jgi:hypothetical protein
MPKGGGGTAEKLLLDGVVLLVPLVEVEGLCGGVSTVRPSGCGWRSPAYVEEPVWCTSGSIEGS